MGARGAQCDHVLQLSDKSHRDERGRRVHLRRAPQEDSLPRQWVPQPRFRRESMCNSVRLVDQDHTGEAWEFAPTQSMLMQTKQRVLEVADEATMVTSRADESCAMVSSLTEEVQQREKSRQLCRMWS